MAEATYILRKMKEEDFAEVHALWMSIHGFGIRSIDDSEENVKRFIRRNPTTSIVASMDNKIVGAILCGHDGRRGCFYHVCVHENYRKHGIGKAMALMAMDALKQEGINKVNLVAFTSNELGNGFWKNLGWTFRKDMNYYEFDLNPQNVTVFNP